MHALAVTTKPVNSFLSNFIFRLNIKGARSCPHICRFQLHSLQF